MNKTIIISLALVAVLGVVVIGKKGYWDGEVRVDSSDGLAAFQAADLSKTSRINIVKGKSKPVVLEKKDGQWVVASAYGYKADPKVADEILASAGKISGGEQVAEEAANHKSFEVDDVRGSFITFFEGDQELASLVIGKTAQSRNLNKTLIYARFKKEAETYRVSSKLRSDAKLWSKIENKNYLEKEVFALVAEDEVYELRISRPGQEDLLVERKSEVVPAEEKADGEAGKEEKKEEGEKKEPETKTVEYFVATTASKTHRVDTDKEWSAKSLVDKGRSLRIEDVAEPKELSVYGLDKPQLKAVCKYRVKDKADAETRQVAILFGNAIKDEKGEDKEFYVTLEGEGNAGRVYTVSKWSYEGWDKKFEDFLPDPKEEEKPAEGAGKAGPVLPGPPVPPSQQPAKPGAEKEKDPSTGTGSEKAAEASGAAAEEGKKQPPADG